MDQPPTVHLEMTPDGQFVGPAATPILARLTRVAVLAAVIAGALGIAFLALWLAAVFIAFSVGVGVVTWVVFRLRRSFA